MRYYGKYENMKIENYNFPRIYEYINKSSPKLTNQIKICYVLI